VDDTVEVRPAEQLPLATLDAYLRRHLEGGSTEPLTVRQFPAGHSNLTYLVRRGAWEAVLRRPPLGPVAPRAHDMAREYRVLDRLSAVFPLAPRPSLLCEDATVIGAPFYLVERRLGLVLDQELPLSWPADPARNRAIAESLVATLVDLHRVDWRAAALDQIGRPDGYLARQVTGWLERWGHARTEPDPPPVERVMRWLRDGVPPSPPATVVHNDYKLNNVMLDAQQPARLVAVLDWEMATVGDPLSDLGTTLTYWADAGDSHLLAGLRSATAAPGFLTRDEFAERYARLSGRDLLNLRFYLAFGAFKVGTILQQIYYRWKVGQTQDARFSDHGKAAQALALYSAEVAGV
jgi:aminoglycoside phosphotransferase (APT) family kinase protein